jgi:nucleoside 2-deoxyribosyltransferase
MADRTRVYFAAPLFSLHERMVNRLIAKAIMELLPDVEVVLPQDFKYHGRFNDPSTFGTIFKSCVDGVDQSKAVIALLDGPDSDSGTCFEVGYAYAKGIPTIGVRTDYRDNQEKGLNLMLSRSCAVVVLRPAFDEDGAALAKDVARALCRVLKPNMPALRFGPQR